MTTRNEIPYSTPAAVVSSYLLNASCGAGEGVGAAISLFHANILSPWATGVFDVDTSRIVKNYEPYGESIQKLYFAARKEIHQKKIYRSPPIWGSVTWHTQVQQLLCSSDTRIKTRDVLLGKTFCVQQYAWWEIRSFASPASLLSGLQFHALSRSRNHLKTSKLHRWAAIFIVLQPEPMFVIDTSWINKFQTHSSTHLGV